MKRFHFVLWAVVTALFLYGAFAADAKAKPDLAVMEVFKAGQDVTSPELVAANFTTVACDAPVSGQVQLAAIVDNSGIPRNAMLVRPLGNDFDRLALNILQVERFKPGEKNGMAVAVAQTVTMKLDGCLMSQRGEKGTHASVIKLRAQPIEQLSNEDYYAANAMFAPDERVQSAARPPAIYRVGNDVSMPVAIIGSTTLDVGNGTKAKYQGRAIFSLVVDEHGLPTDIRVVRPIGMGLDQKGVEALTRARFRPALLKGLEPVPVSIAMEIDFRLF